MESTILADRRWRRLRRAGSAARLRPGARAGAVRAIASGVEFKARLDAIGTQNERLERELRTELAQARGEAAQNAQTGRGELAATLNQFTQALQNQLASSAHVQNERLSIADAVERGAARGGAGDGRAAARGPAQRQRAEARADPRRPSTKSCTRRSSSASANRSSWCPTVSSRCTRDSARCRRWRPASAI